MFVLNWSEFVNVPLGVFYMIEAILYLIGYIPCMLAICTEPLVSNSCYRILAAMGAVSPICFFVLLLSVTGGAVA